MGVANFRSIAIYQFKFQRGCYSIGKSQTEIHLPFLNKINLKSWSELTKKQFKSKKGPFLCVWKAAIIIFLFFVLEL